MEPKSWCFQKPAVNAITTSYNEKLNLDASEATIAFMLIICRVKESLEKLLIREEFEMQGISRLSKMMNTYAKDMLAYIPSKGDDFLMEEIAILEEARAICLPNFLPKTAFFTLLRRKLKDVSTMPHDFVSKVWSYVEEVILHVLGEATENYPNLQLHTQITAQELVDKMRKKSYEFVKEYIDMEMTTDYTYNPDYTKTWSELIHYQEEFMRAVCNHSKPTKMTIGSLGEVEVSHLREKYEELLTKHAFHLRIMLISYWKCVVLRLVDALALHVRYAVNNLVDREFVSEFGKLLEKSSSMMAGKRKPVRKRIQMLEESKDDVLGKMVDSIILISLNE